MRLKLICLLIFFGLLSCCKNDEDKIVTNDEGKIIFLPYLWKIPLHADNNSQSHSLSVVGNNIVDQDKILILTNDNSQSRYLTLISSITGETIWKWNDWYQPMTEDFYGRFTMQHNHQLHWITGTRHYWINLENGETVKKYRGNNSHSFELRAIDNMFWVMAEPEDTLAQYQTHVVYQGDFYDEELKRVLVPTLKLENAIGDRIGMVTSIIPVIENQDTFIITAYQDIFPNWEFQSYLGLYNQTDKTWVYEKVVLGDTSVKGVLYQPLRKFENTVITNVSNSLICYNYYTGEKVWEREFPHDFSFSGFEIADGILVGSCENTVLYGLDARTGNILWTGEGGGTNSKLENRIMNGVVYFGGGSSGFFHAVDIHSGETLWKLDPYKYEEDNAFWTWSVNVVQGMNGEKGRVIIQNALYAYCFEAAK